MRRSLAITVLSLLAAAILTAPAGPAFAADVTVTTTADVVDSMDGLTSLREAVDAANAAAGSTTIVLDAATYLLDLCGADEDTNGSGDLDFTAGQPLTVAGNGATVQQTCDGQRVLHTTDSAGSLELSSLTLTGGEAMTGAALAFAGEVHLTTVSVSGNDAGTGFVLSSDVAVSGASLDIVSSTIGPNVGTGVRISFGTVTVSDSLIWQNTGRGVGLIDGVLTVTGSTITQNDQGGVSTTGQGEGLFTLSGSVVTDNGGTGVTCSACGSLAVSDSTITGNSPGPTSLGGGIVVNLDQDEPGDQPSVTITNSTVASNTREGPGGGLGVFILENSGGPPPAQILLTGSTIASNGALGATGRGGGVYAETGEVRVDNSTLTGNNANVSGGAIFTSTGDIFLRHATVAGNFGAVAANIATGEDLNSFASVVAVGTPGADECGIAGTTISSGYNVGGDGSCAFVAGPGDLNAAGDPLLLALSDNGGPTHTRLPGVDSPLLGRVPAAACTVLTVDQRGVARPQGTACETGAAEVTEALPAPQCTRTGTPGRDVITGTPADDVLCGLGGDDVLVGLGGADVLIGADGADILLGGGGDDILRGGAGDDLLIGGPGMDEFDGGPGRDLCLGTLTTGAAPC